MLTVENVYELACKHKLAFIARYAESSAKDLTPPKPASLKIWFREECVEAWVTLMTHQTEVPVSVDGTRQVTGSGATDGRLMPGYAARLKEVNALRAPLNLPPILN